jgi:hypothetical protein
MHERADERIAELDGGLEVERDSRADQLGRIGGAFRRSETAATCAVDDDEYDPVAGSARREADAAGPRVEVLHHVRCLRVRARRERRPAERQQSSRKIFRSHRVHLSLFRSDVVDAADAEQDTCQDAAASNSLRTNGVAKAATA